ncbi:hypothetical protein pb186bvf_002177 [Paramecium bursaria]
MDREQNKDCIVTLQEENSPCIQNNYYEENPNNEMMLQQYQMEQLRLQQALYQQLISQMPEDPRMNLELIQHQLLQQQLLYNAAYLQQMQCQLEPKAEYDTKIKRKHIKKSHNPQYNTGHWTAQEHSMYMSFLQQHKDVMESAELKKTNKIFKLMSDIIKSRSPSQCRSHHQKFNPYSRYVQVQPNVVRRKMKVEHSSSLQQQEIAKQEEQQ